MSPNSEVMFTKTMTLETGYKVLSKGKIFADKYVDRRGDRPGRDGGRL